MPDAYGRQPCRRQLKLKRYGLHLLGSLDRSPRLLEM
jgi:hypothetical protein